LRDLDEYLRLAPSTPEADQARKTRDHVQGLLSAGKGQASADSPEKKSQDDEDEDEDDPGADTNSSTPTRPENSGLPSLPPPTLGN
jgi:hypothetical protein